MMIQYLDDKVAKNRGYGLGPNKDVCSEVSHNAEVVSGVLGGKHRFVSPLMDAILLVKAGGVMKRLGGEG